VIEYGIDPKVDTCNEAKNLIGTLVSDLRRVVEKAESGIEVCRGCSSLVDLERAYFHDVVEFLFNRTVEDFGKFMAKVKPLSLKNQLRDDLVLRLKRSAAMTVIDSDICRTVLMDDFSELIARFVKDLERSALRTQIAA